MGELPRTLEDSLQQMAIAVTQGLGRGNQRFQIEFRTPGLDLLALLPSLLAVIPTPILVLFPDAGAAALARQSFGDSLKEVTFQGVAQARGDLTAYGSFVLLQTSAIEVGQAEKLANSLIGTPFFLVNPLLDAGAVGIGLAGRQLRARFLNTFEYLYYLEPLEGGAMRRAFPGNWEVWRELPEGDYSLISERGQRPTFEELQTDLAQASESLFTTLGKLFRAMGR